MENMKIAAGGKREKLSDEVILGMVEMIEEGETLREVSEKYGVHFSTVSRYAKQFGVSPSERKKGKINSTTKKIVKKSELVTTKTKPIKKEVVEPRPKHTSIVYEMPPIVEYGLIKDRHEMPVKDFIFEDPTIPNTLMFNYDKLNRMIREWIVIHVPFIDDPTKPGKKIGGVTLQVYITGLTCCTTALVKVCNEMRVNLRLRHFNYDGKRYHTQIIWSKFGWDPRLALFENTTRIELVDCTIDDLLDREFYVLTSTSSKGVQIILFKEMNDYTVEKYKDAVGVQLTSTEKINVFLNKSTIKDSKLCFTAKVFSSLSAN